MPEFFDDVLGEYVRRAAYTPGQLSRLTGIPKQTLVTWLEGRVRKPRNWRDLLRLAAALRLHEEEANRLLTAAGHSSVTSLLQTAQAQQDSTLLSLLAFWLALKQQQETAASLTAAPFQAPPQILDFVGRRPLLAQLEEILTGDGQVCLLRGMGGVGKTTLAIYLAYIVQPTFPDGVLWAALDNAVVDGQLNTPLIMAVLSAFAQAYGRDVHEETSLQSRSSVVRDVLSNKRALIILDNAHGTEDVEHLLPPSTSACSVLITTRNRRMLRGQAHAFDLDPLEADESLALFKAVVGPARIAAEATGAARLIHLLGGLPLALRVVASDLAESESLTLLEYADLLEDEQTRLDHLADWEDAAQDVQVCFELSFRRLPAALQQLFARLSLFGGEPFSGPDFSLEAATTVAALPLVQLKRSLGHLVALSLVETTPSTSGPLRYHLHPLLRLFARKKLEASGNTVAALAPPLVTHFATFARENQRQYHRLDDDWDNISGALRWAWRHQAWEPLLRAVAALTDVYLGVVGFLDARGYWRDATTFLTWLLESPAAAADPLLRAQLLFKLGAFALRQTDATAEQYFHDSLSQLGQAPPSHAATLCHAYNCEFMSQLMLQRDPQQALLWLQRGIAALQSEESPATAHEEGYLHIRHSTILGKTGNLQESMAAAARGLSLLPEQPTAARISGLMTLGIVHLMLGDSEKATAHWQDAIGDAQLLGDSRRLAGLWQNVAIQASWNGRFAQAIADNEKALTLFKRMGDVEGECHVRSNLGDDYLILGQIDAAREHLTIAITSAAEHQLRHVKVFALVNFARLQLNQDDLETADSTLQEAHDICRQLELAQLESEILRLQADLTLRRGHTHEALALVEASLQAAIDEKEEGKSWRLKGNILHTRQESRLALHAYQKSLDILADQNRFEHARSQLALGRYYLTAGQPAPAQALLEMAVATFTALQTPRELSAARSLLDRVSAVAMPA